MIDTDSPKQNVLDKVCIVTKDNTTPVVMFSQDSDKEVIKAEVNAYVVGTISSERLTPVIEAAVARFEETKHLRDELQQTNIKLDERKVVERAKGILMRQRSLDENEAYSLLRSMAMKKSMRLTDLSNQLINAAQMLTI